MDAYKVWKVKRELRRDQQRLAELKYKAYTPTSADLSGMPKGSGGFADGGRTTKMVVEISELEEIILNKQLELIQARKEMELFVETIPNTFTRCIFAWRCIDGKSWKEIYKDLGMLEHYTDGRKRLYELHSIEGLKKMFYRYCEKYGIDYSMQSVIQEP